MNPDLRLPVALAAMFASMSAALAPPQSLAAAPIVGGQAPGYYRMFVGRYEVTALLDGTHPFPAEELAINAKPGEIRALLARQYLSSPVEGMINAFLINTGGKLILIDTGAGDLYGKDGGLLVSNLRAAGYAPEQVDEIYLTHLHRDHAGGLMRGGKVVFPNAIVYASKVEADFWLNNANRAKTPALLYPMFMARRACSRPTLPRVISGRSIVRPSCRAGYIRSSVPDTRQATATIWSRTRVRNCWPGAIPCTFSRCSFQVRGWE